MDSIEEQISDNSDYSDEDFLSYDDDEEKEFPTIQDPNWQEVKTTHNPSWLPKYNVNSGPCNHLLTEASAPLQFFQLIFSDSLFEDIMNWTSSKAAKSIDNKAREKNKMKKWFKLDIKEMKAFVGILYVMGIVKMPKRNRCQLWANLSYFEESLL